MKVYKALLLIELSVFFLLSCLKNQMDDIEEPIDEVSEMTKLIVPDGFTYETNKRVHLTI